MQIIQKLPTTDQELIAASTQIKIPDQSKRKDIDFTARFVADGGSNTERELIVKNGKNPQFQFLRLNHQFRPYYDKKVAEYAKQLGKQPPQRVQNIQKGLTAAEKQQALLRKAVQKQQKLKSLKPPPPDEFSALNVPKITIMEMDRLKLTAQYIAWAGPNFMSEIQVRQAGNPQFDFLKPGHPYYSYFTTILNAYSNTCFMKPSTLQRIESYAKDKWKILEDGGQRFEYEQAKNRLQNDGVNDQDNQQEQKQLAMIDWNDFAVLGTIDFQEEQSVPPPLSNSLPPPPPQLSMHPPPPPPPPPAQIPQPHLQIQPNYLDQQSQQAYVPPVPVIANAQEQFQEPLPKIQPSQSNFHPLPPPPPPPPPPAQLTKLQQYSAQIIMPGQDKPARILEVVPEEILNAKTQKKTKTSTCQKCGQQIPTEELNAHLKICLLSANWLKDKKEMQLRREMTTIASGQQIHNNLKKLKQKKHDIWAKGYQEIGLEQIKQQSDTGKPKKKSEQASNKSKNKEHGQKPSKNVTFSGFLPNLSRTTANVAMLQAQKLKHLQENLENADLKEKQVIERKLQQRPILNMNALNNPLNAPQITRGNNMFPNLQNNQPVPSLQQQQQQQKQQIMQAQNQQQFYPQLGANYMMPPPASAAYQEGSSEQNMEHLKTPGMAWNQMAAMGYDIKSETIQSTIQGNAQINKSNYEPRKQGMSGLFGMDKMQKSSNLINNLARIPEHQWIQMNPNPVKVIIKVPYGGDDGKWQFFGQEFPITVEPRCTIKEVKQKISGYLNNIPISKLWLKTSMFQVLKDDVTVAGYNFLDRIVIEVALKERGGRR